mgnify:CR=1 FL=1
MLIGVLLGIAAGALWGLIYIAPLLLPQYNPVLVALGRFIAFGLVSLPFMFFMKEDLKRFTKPDIIEAFRLPFFGNVVFYSLITVCIRMSGAPLAGMFMAVIPVLVAIVANVRYQREGRGLSWGSITPPLVLIFFGLVIANWTEFQYITSSGSTGLDFWIGVLFGIASTATSQELTNLESNTSYWAKVKAVGSLDSDWSETANATTMDSGGEPLLPTADLLDVVFRNDGSAMDNSSSATPVRRMPSSRP